MSKEREPSTPSSEKPDAFPEFPDELRAVQVKEGLLKGARAEIEKVYGGDKKFQE